MKKHLLMVVAAAAVVGWLGFRLATATDAYTYRMEFSTLPPTDDALREWLSAQPGITACSVRREGQAVVAEYAMPMLGGHPRPDPIREAERLGYGGLRQFTGGYTSRR